MKILFIAAFTFFISINISFAQFRLGLSGELTSARFGGVLPDSASYESVTGIGGSLVAEYKIVEDVYISFQPGYHTRGTRIKFGNEENLINDTVITFDLKQNCITLPLNMKFYNKKFYVGGGIIFDLITSSKIRNNENNAEKDIKNRFTDFDLMADFNLGYEFSIGKPSVFVEFRYVQGLININENSGFAEEDIYKANYKSRGFSLLAGILFPLN